MRYMIGTACVLAMALAVGFSVQAQDEPERKAKRAKIGTERDAAETPTLKVYEWGVATMNWDGSDEGPDDVPDFYYDASEIPLEERPVDKPSLPCHGGAKIRKPVLYFECDRDVTFDLDVKFTRGEVTWMYPRANRRLGVSTAQWDSIKFFCDGLPRDKFAPPELHEVEAGHWTEYSRNGSTGSVVVNGEHERFLFYEGTQTGLPDADIFRNADGQIVIHNHTAHELLDMRICFGDDYWQIDVVPAASGDKPGSVTLTDALLHDDRSGALTAETAKAGLTEAQAKVFERCWSNDFLKANTMSWRRTQKALDELMELKLTLPAGMSNEIKRVGYVLVNNIDLDRQSELEALVAKALEGDAEAEKTLKDSGTAGIGALRRAAAQEGQPLKIRLKIAKILGEVSATR